MNTTIEIELNHKLTTNKLREINNDIVKILSSDQLDETKLMELVERRSIVVEQQLSDLTQEEKKQYAEMESKVNDNLLALISTLKSELKKELSQVSKASKAIKKYRQA